MIEKRNVQVLRDHIILSKSIPYTKWNGVTPGTRLIFRFSGRQPPEYYLDITESNSEWIKQNKPDRVAIWVYGNYTDPEYFIPMLTSNPRIKDFDSLLLKPIGVRMF